MGGGSRCLLGEPSTFHPHGVEGCARPVAEPPVGELLLRVVARLPLAFEREAPATSAPGQMPAVGAATTLVSIRACVERVVPTSATKRRGQLCRAPR